MYNTNSQEGVLMNSIVSKNWDDSILEENATLITRGSGFMSTYDLNNGEMLKVLKRRSEIIDKKSILYYNFFREELDRKINFAPYLETEDIIKPKTAYYSDYRIVAYTVPKVEERTLSSTLCSIKSLHLYSKIFKALTNRIKLLNQNGVILPDFATPSNVFYNKKENRFSFIDYDGMQIWCSGSVSFSNILPMYEEPIENSTKYGNFLSLFTPNLDKLSLVLLFFIYTMDKNITYEINNKISEYGSKDLAFKKVFSDLGIEKSKEMCDLIMNLYDETKENIYPDEVFDQFTKEYKLTIGENKTRRFSKRN